MKERGCSLEINRSRETLCLFLGVKETWATLLPRLGWNGSGTSEWDPG